MERLDAVVYCQLYEGIDANVRNTIIASEYVIVIPAIDLQDGACVRLRQGDLEDSTVFSDDPVKTAGRWVDAGTQRLHIVDLNGAVQGRPVNGEAIDAILKAWPSLDIQIGGGIRDAETAGLYLDRGVRWVIVGTLAVREPDAVSALCRQFPGRIIVGLDAREGAVATDGWAEVSAVSVTELAERFASSGVSAIVYTDIARDGMLEGANVMSTRELAAATAIPVIASGGVRDLEDIRALCQRTDNETQIAGVIVGRSIYEGTLDLAAAQALATQLTRS